ncbi:SIMPL domain-containing protein [Streptomyces sp. BI20]|uniref:SIMPL domain-containing protein n=1 Tax=Streptomyces sp. BI20 TaxID=3403460 RepID=UPI003C75D3EB
MTEPQPTHRNPIDPNPTHPDQPYGTPTVPRVSVRGEARLEVDPEIARIVITVSARGTDRRTTLDDLTRRNNQIVALLKEHPEAVEKIETGALSITPELTRHGRGERVRSHQGRVHITAELGDFTTLGDLAGRIADHDMTRVDGPWWSLRPDSPAHGRARRQAVLDAVQRAREYAEALGSHLTALVELADLGAEGTPGGHGSPLAAPAGVMRSMGYGAGAEAAEAQPLDLEPQRQTVQAQVNARFTMSPPAL